MIYMGYRLASEVHAFTSVPKYGAGTLVLYRAAFAVLGPGHETVVFVNTLCGLLTIPLLLALLARFRPGKGAVAFAAAVLSLAPVFVQDHRTESILVPTLLFLAAGWLLWDTWLTTRSRLDLAGAVVFLALAMTSRPEVLGIAPLGLAVLAWARWTPGLLRGRLPEALLAAAVLAAFIAPHLAFVSRAFEEQREMGALLARGLAWQVGKVLAAPFTFYNLLVAPHLYPLALTALAVFAALRTEGEGRRLARGWLALSLLWLASVQIDMPLTSVPRVQAPLGALVALVAALGFARLLEVERIAGRPLGPPARRALIAALFVGLTALPSLAHFAAPVNEDEEERFIQRALARLPREDVCFVRLDSGDQPRPRYVHRYFPDYLLRPPLRHDRVLGIRRWAEQAEGDGAECPGGTFYIQTLRCYSVYVDFPRETKASRTEPPLIADCRWMHEHARLEPVLVESLPHHGDNEFGYYPEQDSFEVGFYRVRGRRLQR